MSDHAKTQKALSGLTEHKSGSVRATKWIVLLNCGKNHAFQFQSNYIVKEDLNYLLRYNLQIN